MLCVATRLLSPPLLSTISPLVEPSSYCVSPLFRCNLSPKLVPLDSVITLSLPSPLKLPAITVILPTIILPAPITSSKAVLKLPPFTDSSPTLCLVSSTLMPPLLSATIMLTFCEHVMPVELGPHCVASDSLSRCKLTLKPV